MVEDRKNIEELIRDTFSYSSGYGFNDDESYTNDFHMVNPDAKISSLNELLLPNSENDDVSVIDSRLDHISRMEISGDQNYAFVSFNLINRCNVLNFFGEKKRTVLMIFSGYVKKENDKWKFAWLQWSSKQL